MKTLIYLFAFLSFTILACEKVIELDVPYEKPSLVLNGFLNPDSIFNVHLSKSQFVLDNGELKPVSNANIRLYGGEEDMGFMEHKVDGFYLLEGQKPKAGIAYTFKVEAPGFDPVEVKEKAVAQVKPVIIGMDTLRKQENNDRWSYEYLEYTVDLKIPDPAKTKNFYAFKVFERVKGTHQYNPNEEPIPYDHLNPLYLESPDPMLEPFCNFGCGLFLTDEYFDGKEYRVKLAARVQSGNHYGPRDSNEERTLTLGIYHISEATYLYYKTLEINRNTEGDPFAEPAKVYSNVVGGFGILGATTTTFVDLPL